TSATLQRLRRALRAPDVSGGADARLLADYLSRRDEIAIGELVRRHGPMVWGVCRRVLRDHHDAEDAFQATFLVFIRRAASIAAPESLANWLYGVAHQTAQKARATAAKRRTREKQTAWSEPVAVERAPEDELRALLDRELSRVADKYRVAI